MYDNYDALSSLNVSVSVARNACRFRVVLARVLADSISFGKKKKHGHIPYTPRLSFIESITFRDGRPFVAVQRKLPQTYPTDLYSFRLSRSYLFFRRNNRRAEHAEYRYFQTRSYSLLIVRREITIVEFWNACAYNTVGPSIDRRNVRTARLLSTSARLYHYIRTRILYSAIFPRRPEREKIRNDFRFINE